MTAKHVTQQELAERWLVSEATLERWRHEGRGPLYLKLQGRVLYRTADIEAFEQRNLRSSTSEAAGASDLQAVAQ